jgi:hypothetical protein
MERKLAPVPQRALLQHINRRLAAQKRVLKILHHDRLLGQLGRYYVVDMASNVVQQTHVSPEALAKELGVLKGWEQLEASE